MKLGVLTAMFLDRSLPDALDAITSRGVETVEIPVGGYFPTDHVSAAELVSDRQAVRKLVSLLTGAGVEVSALAVHGNPLHPDDSIAGSHATDVRAAIKLADELGAGRVTLLAGLPGGAPGDSVPNWITQPFPPELQGVLAWQWDSIATPFWENIVKDAEHYGVDLCFEMVPGDLVCNPMSLLKLRDRIGPRVAANLDPSHFFFLGVDPVSAVTELGSAIRHVHAKDARVNQLSTAGLMDPRPYGEVKARGWSYRTIGYGHDEAFWREFFDALRLGGYDDVVSIEHEDVLFTASEGLDKAIELLRRVVPFEPMGESWWGA